MFWCLNGQFNRVESPFFELGKKTSALRRERRHKQEGIDAKSHDRIACGQNLRKPGRRFNAEICVWPSAWPSLAPVEVVGETIEILRDKAGSRKDFIKIFIEMCQAADVQCKEITGISYFPD